MSGGRDIATILWVAALSFIAGFRIGRDGSPSWEWWLFGVLGGVVVILLVERSIRKGRG